MLNYGMGCDGANLAKLSLRLIKIAKHNAVPKKRYDEGARI